MEFMEKLLNLVLNEKNRIIRPSPLHCIAEPHQPLSELGNLVPSITMKY